MRVAKCKCCRLGDLESCGETCDRFCPCISMYPSLCTAFLTLLGAALVSSIFGAYAFISYRLSIFQFHWPMSWNLIINSSFLAVVVIIPLIILSLLLWCVCTTRRRAWCFKTCFIFALLISIIALAACMVSAILVIYGASEKTSFFVKELEHVWMAELGPNTNSTLACRVQHQLNCRGFEEGDCVTDSPSANTSRCAQRCRAQDSEGQTEFNNVIYKGCRERMASYFIRWNAVLLSGTAIACILTLIALFVSCTISFERDFKA